jgi:hypothetical protein
VARLFKRACNVTLARPRSFSAQDPNAILVEKMRVQFVVTKHRRSEPNTCEVVITNLSADTRAALQIKPLHVRLDAGYDGQLHRLFVGDVRFAESVRDGAEWHSVLHVGDGARAYRHARVNRSYREGVTARALLAECASAMALVVPPNAAAIAVLDTQFVNGITLNGQASRELDRILEPLGVVWSIQDGRLQVLLRDDARSDPAILVNQDTGLIGSPAFGSPPQKGEKATLSFKMLLYPGITPGGLVSVQSREINGVFKVDRVAHTGDTHGDAWFSDVECRAYR